jgi:hypothetical protein
VGRGVKKGDNSIILEPRCNVIVPAEYAYGEGSTATRTLVVELAERIDDVKLQECQDEPLLVSTFYYYFIQWYVTNYHEIRDVLKEWLGVFRRTSFAGVIRRLNETYFCLNSAFALFLQYCFEKGYVTSEEAEDTLKSFQHLLTKLIYAQNERVEQSSNAKPKEIDSLERIRAMCDGGQLLIADSADLYVHGVHDGLIHDKHLCLRPDKLEEKIRLTVPTASKREITKELFAKGALKRDSDGSNSRQIYATGNKRFYHIPLGKLD